jgi:hypothetical protein
VQRLAKFLCFFILTASLNSQVKIVDSRGLNFKSLTASFYEPKMGLMKYLDRNSLKVDIGNSVDLISVKLDRYDIVLSADFFAYALINNYGFLILRVEAIDGFFGGNVSMIKNKFSVRFRVLHRSAHLIDEYDELNRRAFPFTREFFDLVLAFVGKNRRLYGGAGYVFRTKPSDIEKFQIQFGFEFSREISNNFGFIQSPLTFIFAADVKFLNKVYAFNSTSGFKLGNWNSGGILVYFVYYNGFDIFGQYFNLKRKFGGFGCSFEF